jgi:hypothetical protein
VHLKPHRRYTGCQTQKVLGLCHLSVLSATSVDHQFYGSGPLVTLDMLVSVYKAFALLWVLQSKHC